MRGYKSIIQEAELLAMSPEAVAEFLKKRAKQSMDELDHDPVDQEAEVALRGRSSPLIDLALARYARFMETLRPIFQSSKPCGAVRLAVLSNGTRWPAYTHFPVELFGERKQEAREQAAAWLAEAPKEELCALLENPWIDDDFLSELLERSKPWDALSDESLMFIVAILSHNERMWTPREDFVDGSESARYNAVFDSAWKLAESVEPSESWARALSYLYDRLEPYAFSIKEPLRLVNRWRPEPSNSKLTEKETKDNARGSLSDYQGVRRGLAKLALSKNSNLLPGLLTSDDPGLRAAAYADGRLTPEQLLAANEREGRLVFDQAVRNRNLWLWRTAAGREALGKVAQGADSEDWYWPLYKNIWAIIAKEHPDWFKDGVWGAMEQ
jgi:hypothetical protein